MKQIYISFDDTDTLNTPGTGHLLTRFLESLPYDSSYITRHQLFVSPDVPYTSHNSAMCSMVTGEPELRELIDAASAFLEETFISGADPGLCIACADEVLAPEKLVQWGYRAKKEILTKAEAYALAEACHAHLSEHGGTGQGVVGALAAVGLRLGGQDGRVKGRREVSRDRLTVAELLRETGFDRVSALGEGTLGPDEQVLTGGERIKAVYQDYRSTVLTVRDGASYRPVEKDVLKSY